MRPEQRQRISWAVALLAGLLLRCFFVLKHPRFVGDTLIYSDLAANLLKHHIYGLTEDGNVRATLIRLPGYPLFLAACSLLFGTGNFLAVVWVQVAVDLLSCVLLAATAQRLFGARTGLCCVWLAALCPFTANYAAAPLTETLSIFCVVLGFWGLVRWREDGRVRHAVAVGGALSGALLLRPDGILLAGALLPAMAWPLLRASTQAGSVSEERRGHSWTSVAVAAGLLFLTVGVWTLRNWRVYHVVQPLAPKYANDPGEPTPLGFSRWYRTWATGLGDTTRVYWEYDGAALRLADLPPWAFDSAQQRQQTAALYRRYNDETSSTPAFERDFGQLAAERIHTHPLRFYVLLPLARLGDMWLRPRTEAMQRMPLDWWDLRARPWAAAFSYLYGALNLLLLGLAARGWHLWRRSGWTLDTEVAYAMAGFVLLRSALLLTIDNSEPRYTLECFPVVLLLASLAVMHRRRSTRQTGLGRSPVATSQPSGSPR